LSNFFFFFFFFFFYLTPGGIEIPSLPKGIGRAGDYLAIPAINIYTAKDLLGG
jgi:hypothetical protein